MSDHFRNLLQPVARALQTILLATTLSTALPTQAADLPANTWTLTQETRGGTLAGITALPDDQGLLYFGYPPPNITVSDLRIYQPETRQWTEPLPGRGPHQARGSVTTVFSRDGRPGLPAINRPYWLAYQSVYVPTMNKVLFFAGGSTFTYDPKTRRWDDLAIPLDQSPPDVMLGSLAWDPVGKRVILFGGGYISAYKPNGDNAKAPPLNGKPWQPADWTLAEKRATWAFDPETRRWQKIATGSPAFNQRYESAGRLLTQIETLAGATRGIALEYGDKVTGKSAPALADDVQAFIAETAAFADRLTQSEEGIDDYEKRQSNTAVTRLRELSATLQSATAALRKSDGWKALQALEVARRALVEAIEDLAPSPLPRYYANLVTDTRNKLLVLFGGHGSDRILADTWVFDSARNQWRQSRATGHPPPTAIPALSYDSTHGLVLLATGWLYDAARDEWRRLPFALQSDAPPPPLPTAPAPAGQNPTPFALSLSKGERPQNDARSSTSPARTDSKAPPAAAKPAPKNFFLPWTALAYDPQLKLHIAVTTGDNLAEPDALRVAHLHLDPSAARPADFSGPRWQWADDKYQRAWAALPKDQAEYRTRVAAQRARLDKLPTNTWTRIDTPYKAQDRSYGSFALDPDRGQLIFWGGGHSAYMGNEVSQYDIKGNLWLESWPPELPPWPFGSPDGDGWNPPFYHRKGASHGYHNYIYSKELGKVLFGGQIYDPDRMRWSERTIRKAGPGALGIAVDMSGADASYFVSAKHWYGAPFGVWRLMPADKESASDEWQRLPRSDTPFATNDRAKPVFDTQRKRILFYGARDESPGAAKSDTAPPLLYAFDIAKGGWAQIPLKITPPATQALASMAWGIAYSAKQDALLLLPGGKKQDNWLIDLADITLRRFAPGPDTGSAGTNGLVYSAADDLFITLETGRDGVGPVTVHALRLRK